MVLNASGYNRINNLGNPDTGIGLQIYMHELGSQVFIGNFYSYALYVFLNVQLSNDVTYANSITTVKIKIPAGKMFQIRTSVNDLIRYSHVSHRVYVTRISVKL